MNLKDVKIEKVLFDGNQINIYHVTIRPDEYKICVDCACNMWANKKEGHLLWRLGWACFSLPKRSMVSDWYNIFCARY